jgi:hypothetical protein
MSKNIKLPGTLAVINFGTYFLVDANANISLTIGNSHKIKLQYFAEYSYIDDMMSNPTPSEIVIKYLK